MGPNEPTAPPVTAYNCSREERKVSCSMDAEMERLRAERIMNCGHE